MTREDLFIKIGQRIREERIKSGLSITELADKIDMEYNNLIRIEKGRTNPTIGTLHSICQALNINLYEMINFNNI